MPPNLVDRPTFTAEVDYRVAVGADRAQIVDWVYGICFANLGKRFEMVDVDESFRDRTVNRPEVAITNRTYGSVEGDASGPRFRVPLVCVDNNPSRGPLNESASESNLSGQLYHD